MKAVITQLEALFTADTSGWDKAAKKVETEAKGIEKKPTKQKIDGDPKGALDSMGRVETEAKKIVSAKTMATVDANIDKAETSLSKVQERLDYLHSVEATMEVTADIKRAETALSQITRRRDALVSAKSTMEVGADDTKAQSVLKRLVESAKAKGDEAGEGAGKGLTSSLDEATRGAGEKVGEVIGGDIGDTLESALTAIPIAGGIILAAAAIGKAITGAIQEGMQQEVGRDRLQALTGIDEASAKRLANAAAEAYANTFGESVEANMDTAKLALQFDLIDEKSATRDSQKVIEGLSGIADVLGEDVRPTAQAVSVMLSTGVAKSAQEAFDILATGAREGVNRSEDLLDTYTEYPALFKRLGLSGAESLGLINQSMKAGARNSDLAADALKEFQIRATDGSTTSAQGFQLLGLSASQMTAQIAKGGDSAKTGLDTVLDRLRAMTDPVKKNAAAVALFGTQAEDLGNALFAMDLSSAVKQLNGVTGSAQKMFDTLSDNDANKVESAFRNINVAADGLKGALATAFSKPLGDFATWVSSNRGPLLQFFVDLVNGALDFAEAANKGIGDFVSGPLATAVEGLAELIEWLPGDQDVSDLKDLATSMKGFDSTTSAANASLETMRGKFNGFADQQVKLGYVHDATVKVASAIDAVGSAADGSSLKVANMNLKQLDSTESGKRLESQIKASVEALGSEMDAAAKAGESQDQLSSRYNEGTTALMTQLTQMGLTQQQAYDLITAYGGIPATKGTTIRSNATSETTTINGLAYKITHLPDGTVKITADTSAANTAVDSFVNKKRVMTIEVRATMPDLNGSASGNGRMGTYAHGALVEFMAPGGLRGLTPMQPIAQMVPANTWRVVGDRGDVPEAYVPLDGSPRSWAILAEALRRMPGVRAMESGGVLSTSRTATLAPMQVSITVVSPDPEAAGTAVARKIARLS